jgi:hypothetical protein
MMKRFSVVLTMSLLAAACSGATNVATVDGFSLSLSDIPVEPDGFEVAREVFLNALNWEIRDRVLLKAAEVEFQITLDSEEVSANAAAILAGLPPASHSDPRANFGYFETQARVVPGVGLLWPLLAEELGDLSAATNWANNRLRNADVRVKRRFGVWRVNPDPLVYPE